MPFRFLNLKKDKPEKLKNKSKSTTDLLEIRKILAQGNDVLSSKNNGMKTKSKSRLRLFSNMKSNSQVNMKEAKKDKEDNIVGLMDPKKRGSVISYLSIGSENGESTDVDSSDHNLHNNHGDNMSSGTTPRPTRSASCCAIMELTNRERRMSDIAQLDQYIEYHQRRGTDDGSNAKRLVCAQLIRHSFMKVEQMRQGDPLRPQEKSALHRSMSNLNSVPCSGANHFQKNKPAPARRWSQWSAPVQLRENRLSSLEDQDRRRSWMHVDSDERDEDMPNQFVCKPSVDISLPDNEPGYKRECDQVDILNSRYFLKKPKFMSKRKSVPMFTASEIEIF